MRSSLIHIKPLNLTVHEGLPEAGVECTSDYYMTTETH